MTIIVEKIFNDVEDTDTQDYIDTIAGKLGYTFALDSNEDCDVKDMLHIEFNCYNEFKEVIPYDYRYLKSDKCGCLFY